MGPIDSILGFYLHAYLHLTFTKNFDLSIFWMFCFNQLINATNAKLLFFLHYFATYLI